MRHLRYLLRNRIPTSLYRVAAYSTANKQEDSFVLQDLLERTEKYRKELRYHVRASPTARNIIRSVNVINQSIVEAKRKQLEEILDDMNQKPDIISLEVLSNGTMQLQPVVFIRTPFTTYLFNCPEGTGRFMSSMRIRSGTIRDFFITRGTWDCMGGLFGVLLGNEEVQEVRIHGPQKIKYFLEMVRPCADSDFGGSQAQPFMLEERTFEKVKYEDAALTAYYIPVFAMNSKSGLSESMVNCDTAYLIELKEPNKRLDVAKLVAMKVPKGPSAGILKAGNSITLDDGTVIKPEDVYAEDSKDHAPNVLVVECDCIEKLQSLVTNGQLQKYVNGQKQMGYMVHYTPDSVLSTKSYQMWMKSFGTQCLHLVANGNGEALPISDGIYRQQQMLTAVCPDLFPSISGQEFRGVVTQQVDLPEPPSTNIVYAKILGKYPMRTARKVVNNEAIALSFESDELYERIADGKDAEEALQTFKEAVKTIDDSDGIYPSVTFLGTGSACPAKYRNVSGHWLQLNERKSVMVDCGEGTYGQLKVFAGPERIVDVLLNLSAIFITHAHLDHFSGVYTLIQRRWEAFHEKGLEYKKLIVFCNGQVRKTLTLYRANFFDLDQYIDIHLISLYLPNPADFDKHSLDNLVVEQTKVLSGEFYNAEEWGLKAIYAVQVHHTKMSSGFVFDMADGKRIVFSGDTMPCQLLAKAGKDADLLIHEATFEDLFERDALRKKHSTTGQALDIAKQMNAKYTILSHFSARYPRVPAICDSMLQAGNVGVAMDNMIVPFNKRAILPMLLPVYIALFDKELHDVSLREMRRNIQDMLDKNTRLSEPDGHDGIRKKPKGVFPAPLPPKRSRSPNFKRPRRENDTSEA